MSGAGETKTHGIQLVSGDAGETLSSADAAVRLYWKKGMVWTVYRSAGTGKRGVKSVFFRMSERIRRRRKRLVKFLMQPWP